MIFVTDKGQMANNILQYGHLYAWGREHGRPTMSMRFAYKYQYFYICHTRHHHFLMYLLGKYASRLHIIPTVNFTDINSDYQQEQHTMSTHRHVLATGWCARFPDLFLKYKPELRALFAFLPTVKAPVDQMLEPFDNRIKLGVHIRRGDYARWCHGRYFFSDKQYLHAIREFIRLNEGKEVEVFICSNDPNLDRTFYQESLGRESVHFPQGNAAEDLYLLSQCDSLIGPPSSYSLVASMYRDTPVYWISDAEKTLENSDFDSFDNLFRKFDSYYIE